MTMWSRSSWLMPLRFGSRRSFRAAKPPVKPALRMGVSARLPTIGDRTGRRSRRGEDRMRAWYEFYAVTGAAAATLLGLLFVAVSVNAGAILGVGHESSKRLAGQAFQNYVAVISVSLLALFPQLSTAEFGRTALALTAISAIWVLVRVYQTIARPHDLETRIFALRRYVASLIGFGMLIAAASLMATGDADHGSLFAISTVVLLLSATTVSWELLVRVARAKGAGGYSGGGGA